MMLLLILCAVAACLLLVHVGFNYNQRARMLAKVSGPKKQFIVGNGLEVLVSPAELFNLGRQYATKWKGIYRFWCFPIGTVNIYNPEDIEIILSGSKFNEKSSIYSFLQQWLGDGLLLSGGKKWQLRRKILTPAFHFNILRYFVEILEENSRRMTDKLDGQNGKLTIDVTPLLSEYTLNSICETAMGTRLDKEKTNAGRHYKRAIYELGDILVKRFSRVYLHFNAIFKLSPLGQAQRKYVESVHSFTRRVIQERKDFVESNKINFQDYVEDENSHEDMYMYGKKKRIAMLDLLISAEKDGLIDTKGIQEEVDTFMFEGHDTTASGLVYFLMLLANHKDIQDRVLEEVESILGDNSGAASMQDLNKMKYLECCIKESLRLYPPVPFISRILKEPVVLSKHLIPAGTDCHIHIYDLHRCENLFPDAHEFKPERFLPENSVARHPYSYIPFSAGPRNCIGQRFAMLELKSAVSTILRKFELQPVTKPSDLQFISDLVLRNNAPVYVSFINRNKSK